MIPNLIERIPRRQAGFTLVELLVASTVLGITAIALVTLTINMGILGAESDHARQARLIAVEELEDPARSYLRYASIATGSPPATTLNLDAESAIKIPASIAMSFSLLGTNIAGTTVPYKTVRTTITWSEGGASQNVVLYKRIVRLYQ